MNRSIPVGEVRRLGDRSLLVGVPDPAAARALARVLAEPGGFRFQEVVGGHATVMVTCAPDEDTGPAVAWLTQMVAAVGESLSVAPDDSGGTPDAGSVVRVPCVFDGPDLPAVAEMAGCSDDEVIAMLTAEPLTVTVVGFSPGFAYLSGLPSPLRDIPRRDRPRPAVPAGSVALANGHAAVYPTASPGGWQLIGRTHEMFFTPDAPPYARLAPGDRVQFDQLREPVDTSPRVVTPAPWSAPPSAVAVFEVEEAGMWTVLQDGGRTGLAAIGVPGAGPADPFSFELANRLVGNERHAGALEVTARGPALRTLHAALLAVVGAAPGLRLDGQPVATGQVFPVNPGQRLVVGAVEGGLRTYVAVAGGFVGPAVLGSTASDQLAGLGPGPLSAGVQLWAAPVHPPLGDHLGPEALPPPSREGAVTLRVVPGPHPERFAPDAFAALGDLRFTVGSESNRVGLRLVGEGGTPAVLGSVAGSGELDSQGVVTGAVQIPPGGHPVVLLPDHATLGGYPVLAVVASVDHGLLGQCRAGSVVTFAPIGFAEAREALMAHRRLLERAVMGHYPLAVE